MLKVFHNFHLLTMQPNGEPYGLVRNGSMVVEDGIIQWLGPATELPDTKGAHGIVGPESGAFLSPGLIDCHTHLVYGGNRADEWEKRLTGVPYDEIARQGGGILSSVRATRAATEDELVHAAAPRLDSFIRQGVTTVEIKSGYGLDTATELKMLKAARRLEDEHTSIVTTLLAAHAVPPEFNGRADDYVDLVCNETIPAATDHCHAVDVFCESIAFDLQQSQRVLEAARRAGLEIKIHAEQLTHTGSCSDGRRNGCVVGGSS